MDKLDVITDIFAPCDGECVAFIRPPAQKGMRNNGAGCEQN